MVKSGPHLPHHAERGRWREAGAWVLGSKRVVKSGTHLPLLAERGRWQQSDTLGMFDSRSMLSRGDGEQGMSARGG